MYTIGPITFVPIIHGRIAFAQQIRRIILNTPFDCIAVDLPSVFEPYLAEAIERLPHISAISADQFTEQTFFLPVDPCDPAIEAVRQAISNRIPFRAIGNPDLAQPPYLPPLPEELILNKIGFDAYCALCLHTIGIAEPDSFDGESALHCATELVSLTKKYSQIIAVVHMNRFSATIRQYQKEANSDSLNRNTRQAPSYRFRTDFINPDQLYFALTELPFIAGKYEQNRYDVMSAGFDHFEAIKNLFRETRDNYFEDRREAAVYSPARIQCALTYVRNLSLMDLRITPTLFDIVSAAKGIGGNSFAINILKSAKYYPFLPLELSAPTIAIGTDRVQFSDEANSRPAINLMRDIALEWKTIPLKHDPSLNKKREYTFNWDPSQMCSHLPEDTRIESFNSHIRTKAIQIHKESFGRTEKFTSSVRDGIDIRETLRNWHTGDIYVKELPPLPGRVDTVVIIFDDKHDDLYPQCTTWYAEHPDESTLSFYGTDPFSDMIGPGIARCRYGGLSLLFPPRPVPNIFELTQELNITGLSTQLVYGALLFSHEPMIAIVSQNKPGIELKKMAADLKKRIIWIPLGTFSAETLVRLQQFHVLNGKQVRSWAQKFIAD